MAKINLEKMSLADLKSLQKEVAKAITSFEARKRIEARIALEAVAKEHGMSIGDILGTKKGKKARAKAPPKYQNPKDQSQTWSGRGRQPEWFKVAVKKGASPESLAI